ncbi:MAG TPA: UbiA family prenyltransferase [Candidatus Thermoplasmatota archaeon]|nr:UbiA family prenyltransferase [Candidatus Thermoplasmatota archaeon]
MLRLLRPANALMAAVGTLAGMVLAPPAEVPLQAWLAAPAAAFLLAAWGNVRNDLADVEVDRVAHPQRPLPAGRVEPRHVRILAAALLAAALACAHAAAGWPTLAMASANALFLAAYEWRLKATGLPGNLVVALLVASTFLFGAVTTRTDPLGWGSVTLLAAMALMSNLAREVLKDTEDMAGDAGHRLTFPMRAGEGHAIGLAVYQVLCAVLLSTLAFLFEPVGWWRPWLLLLLAADALFLLAAARAFRAPGPSQRLLKLAMGVALTAFLAGPLLGRA